MASSIAAVMFSTPEMLSIFDERATWQSMLDVEAALARAAARVGLVPAAASVAIADACRAGAYDLPALATAAQRAGTPVIPLVKELTARVQAMSPGATAHVHLGATSQDIVDTGLVLQLRPACQVLLRDFGRIAEAIAVLTDRHRRTIMLGRTLLQPGPPITFGLKAAGWLISVDAAIERIDKAAEDALVLQFGGATGTLAALGDSGLQLSEALADELGLRLPALPWHTRRDALATLAAAIGIAIGSLGKIATDIALLMQSEIAEAAEPVGDGRGGSSAMPHKRNATGCMIARSAAERAPGLVSTLLHGLSQEHERALGGWQAEWPTIPALFEAAAGAANTMIEVLEGLTVDPARMMRNLEDLRGIVFAERAAIALTGPLGRQAARDLLEDATRETAQPGRHLRDILAADKRVCAHLSQSAIDAIFDPASYLGSTDDFIRRALEQHAAHRTRRVRS